ncbi:MULTISPECIES: DUF3461 family protein [Vibrio]|uniref:DUF3461 family protein n=1 Tax=Vibrio casei TaxID=673372 RepID=A0A368LLW1_9VIBR|nr:MULTISPECIES: DUF3461 family protein [Vibrio]RCS72776.1 DUF3461 family protein [Vibrio casei]SJN39262.1 UPF0325 protein YaeH [Vibrio casei]HBV74925.1 DUF3461 domain-containing protein [Vibrio sp.]
MYPNLNKLGITDTKLIARYSLRQEAQVDVLKVYFHKQKGDLFAKSVKFKYPRQRKNIRVNSNSSEYKETTEVSPSLTKVMTELNQITKPKEMDNKDIKHKILTDLRHLEKVVSGKIAEIEADLEKLK